MSRSPIDTTRLFLAASSGDDGAADQLGATLYDELRHLAAARMRKERNSHTLQATALVHEAYLRLVDQSRFGSLERAEFLALAARAMHRVLLDHARKKGRDKRGGQLRRITLDTSIEAFDASAIDVLALEEALEVLAALEPRLVQLVELRVYGGLSNEELASVLKVSLSTIEKNWRWVRAWLRERLGEDESDS